MQESFEISDQVCRRRRRRRFEYESSDSSREEMKRKFAHTMEFVEEYLRDVVSQPYPFGDKDKNELTLEVWKNKLVFVCRLVTVPPSLRHLAPRLFFRW